MKRIAGLLVAALFLNGCLISSSNHEKIEGKYVPENTYSQIEPGKTTGSWLKATLGEPSERAKDETAGSEIWKYNYRTIKEGSGAIFLIFGGESKTDRPGTVFFEVKDGVVKKKWRN